MLFTVVIGTYNHGNTIAKCLEALNAQTYQGFEIKVCDDGSTDDTLEIVRTLAPDAQVFTWKNRGMRLAASLNRGIREAKGEQCLFIMGDSFPETDYLEVLKEHARPHRVLNGVRYQVDGSRILDLEWRLKKGTIPMGNVLLSGQVWNMMTGNGLLIPTWALREYGGWDPKLKDYTGEDNELVARMFFRGLTCWSITDAKLYHVWHPEKPTGEENSKAVERLIWGYMNGNFRKYGRV